MLSIKLETLLTNVLAAVLFLYCLSKFDANLSHTLQCVDTGWLIKTGQYIIAHGIPATDPFNFTCPERAIVIYQWLFAVALGALYQYGGLWLVALASTIVVALLYLWYLPSLMLRQGIKPVYVFGLLSLVCSPIFFWARPQLISFALIAVFTVILEQFRQHGYDKRLWLLPLLMVLWANSHSFWFIGLAMVATYLVPAIGENKCTNRKTLTLLLLSCLGAVLVNPYGWGLVQYNLSFTTEPDFGSIRELQPVILLYPKFNLNLLLYLMLAWLAIINGRRSVPLAGLILAASSTCAALMFYRFIPVAILLTWPYFALTLSKIHFFNNEENKKPNAPHQVSKFSRLPTRGLPLIALACAVLFFLRQFPIEKPVWFTNSDTNFETTKFLKQHPDLTKNMFCDPSIGSCLIFEDLWPVFIDTRFDFYGRRFCTEYNNCFNAEEGWQEYLKKWHVSSLCVDDTYPIYKALLLSPNWLPVFDDKHFSVWLPNNEAGAKRKLEVVNAAKRKPESNLMKQDLPPATRRLKVD